LRTFVEMLSKGKITNFTKYSNAENNDEGIHLFKSKNIKMNKKFSIFTSFVIKGKASPMIPTFHPKINPPKTLTNPTKNAFPPSGSIGKNQGRRSECNEHNYATYRRSLLIKKKN
jgi:hypothetical protein